MLIDYLVVNGMIDEADREIYYFGLKEGLIFFSNVLLALLLSSVARDLKSGVVFLGAFFPVRRYVGGFHAKSRIQCFWYSMTFVWCALRSIDSLLKLSMKLQCISIMSVSILLYHVSPLENYNKPLNIQEIYVYKQHLLIILLIECIVAFSAANLCFNYVTTCIFIALVTCLALNFLGRLGGQKRINENFTI